MKKIITIIIILLVNIVILVSCSRGKSYNESSISTDNLVESITTEESDVSLNEEKSDESMDFQYFYRGFIPLNYDQQETYPRGTYVIETIDDWSDFADKYLPGIYYYVDKDFSKYYLVVDIAFPPKSICSDEVEIKSFSIINNKLEVEYDQSEKEISSKIYAQNPDDIVNVFVNIIRISKDNIDNIDNIYKK